MKDQVDGLRVDGVAAAYLNSSLTRRSNATACLRACATTAAGCCAFRRNGSWAKAARGCGVCLQQFGRPVISPSTRRTASASGATISVRNTGSSGGSARSFRSVSLHAFTATATERVRRRHRRRAGPDAIRSCWSARFDRPNLTLPRAAARATCSVSSCRSWRVTKTKRASSTVLSRREVESLATWLRSTRATGRCPTMQAWQTTCAARHQEAFLDERADIVVATVAFGMGIDRSNVRFVIHAGAPRSLGTLSAGIGTRRARRAAGRVRRSCTPGADFVRWRQMLEANGELTDSARALLRDMERYAAGTRLPAPFARRIFRRAVRAASAAPATGA